MNTYHFVLELEGEGIWTVEDVEHAFRATYPTTIEAGALSFTVRPYDPAHPSLRGYPHGHLARPKYELVPEDYEDYEDWPLTVQEGSSNVGDEREVA